MKLLAPRNGYEAKLNTLIPKAHAHACTIAGKPVLYSKIEREQIDTDAWDKAYHSKMDELAHLAGIRKSINHSADTFGKEA